jgi:hypothetical protein
MGLSYSKPEYTHDEIRYMRNLIKLNEEVRAYPFQHKCSEQLYEAMEHFTSAIKSGDKIAATAFAAEKAFEQWRNSMFGPMGYFPSKYLIFNTVREVF